MADNQLILDQPLRAGAAIDGDELQRKPFAEAVVEVLKRVGKDTGLVVSLEGPWGCGKTSAIAMVEDLLEGKNTPVVVHFNPWLIGDREALLRQLLAAIAKAAKLSDHAKAGKDAAKQLKSYAKAFDVLKLIPGAEPWASMVKGVVEAMGEATDSIADYKTPDIEKRKEAVEDALRKLDRSIVVMIDDLDRLFPAEIFEMIRIVKAVGELPNVAYVLAHDPRYVSEALTSLHVPAAEAYLDKVVQVRMSIPPLSEALRANLLDGALRRLPEPARRPYFADSEARHSLMFYYGLRDLIEHPRDVNRTFDVVATLEPRLREELHLADIVALAALMTKASPVFRLLQRKPYAFTGIRTSESQMQLEAPGDVLSENQGEVSAAIETCENPTAVRDLLQFIFPRITEGRTTFEEPDSGKGHLGAPDRLEIALKQGASSDDIKLSSVTRFIRDANERSAILGDLSRDKVSRFLREVGQSALDIAPTLSQLDIEELALSIARAVDQSALANGTPTRQSLLDRSPEAVAVASILRICAHLDDDASALVAERTITAPDCLSVAARMLMRSYWHPHTEGRVPVRAPESRRSALLGVFAGHVRETAEAGRLFGLGAPDVIFGVLGALAPADCRAVFNAIEAVDPTLDSFVLEALKYSFDSAKGQAYKLPDDHNRIENFVPLNVLRDRGRERLNDSTLPVDARAAWQSVVDGEAYYAVDASRVPD